MDQLLKIEQLEFLTKLGREEDSVDILGTKFTFKTLTVDESTQAFESPSKQKYTDDLARFNAFRIEVLSKAILKINNLLIPDTMRERVKGLLQRSQQVVINKLFDSYQQLLEKQGLKFATADAELDGQTPTAEVPVANYAGSPLPPAPPILDMRPLPPQSIQEKSADALAGMSPEDYTDSVNIVNPTDLFGSKK